MFKIVGGISRVRFRDLLLMSRTTGPTVQEILLATEVRPRKGPWVKLTDLVWDHVPDDQTQLYYPDSIGLSCWEDDSDVTNPEPPLWLYNKELKLRLKPKTISDPEIIRYLFDRLHGIFSFFVWDFKDDGKRYSLALTEVPGWYEQKYINKALTKVRKNGYSSTER
jgi:hypothetical protein